MESDIPNFDLPVDYIVGEGYEIDLSKRYKNFPCRVRSGFFILCVKGVMQTTINGNLHHIGENDLITLLPGYSYLLCWVLSRIYRRYKFNEIHRTSSSCNYGKPNNNVVSITSL